MATTVAATREWRIEAMRNGQNKRMRGRSRNKGHNPLTRVYESNGPDVKIRGTASHVAEKYQQLARDAHASGDPIAAENYQQHAEHYFRLIAAAQEQFRQNNPYYQNNRPEGGNPDPRSDDAFEDGEDDGAPQMNEQPAYGSRDPQPYLPRDAQFYPPRDQQPRAPQQNGPGQDDGNVDRLPSFITGGGQQGQPAYSNHPQQGNGGGYDNQERQGGGDRFPLHRRRRRHRGPRNDVQGMPEMSGHDGADDAAPGE
jgi:type II secretory pathway pseudopilin PulG